MLTTPLVQMLKRIKRDKIFIKDEMINVKGRNTRKSLKQMLRLRQSELKKNEFVDECSLHKLLGVHYVLLLKMINAMYTERNSTSLQPNFLNIQMLQKRKVNPK